MVSPFLLLPALAALARATKVTFDDRAAAWTLSPLSVFGTISKDEPCQACTSQPDPDKAFDKTWRDCTDKGTATLTFTGVGVTIYTICPGPHNGGIYVGHFTFTLDGKQQPEFQEASTGCDIYRYNYPVYTVAGLPPGTHTISITNMGTENRTQSNLILDYAVVDDGGSSQSSKKGLPVSAIVVPVILVVLLTIAGMVYLILRKKHMQREAKLEAAAPLPYKAPSIRSIDGSTAMSPYYLGRGSEPGMRMGRIQAVGNDPELEAALHIIASRSRSAGGGSPPGSPGGPTTPPPPAAAWPRDRKATLRTPTGSHNTTPQSSAVGTNWSNAAATPAASHQMHLDGATPPAYVDATQRRY